MLFLGVLAMVGVAAITLIAALIFDDYKAIEVADRETGTERDVSSCLRFLIMCIYKYMPLVLLCVTWIGIVSFNSIAQP